ncbi:MAG: hypothetical protein ABIY55_29630 [Kofleriaceae bacterium]
MTTRDARDEEPRGAERDAGDTNDELAGEDSKLSAMRSVWLAMRDEEPSSGGLAVLMAAARGKAAELAPTPTWWQRVVAGLRRPPALAFATVLVLLGGALVVGRRLEREGAPTAHWASEPQRTRPEVVGGAVPAAGWRTRHSASPASVRDPVAIREPRSPHRVRPAAPVDRRPTGRPASCPAAPR